MILRLSCCCGNNAGGLLAWFWTGHFLAPEVAGLCHAHFSEFAAHQYLAMDNAFGEAFHQGLFSEYAQGNVLAPGQPRIAHAADAFAGGIAQEVVVGEVFIFVHILAVQVCGAFQRFIPADGRRRGHERVSALAAFGPHVVDEREQQGGINRVVHYERGITNWFRRRRCVNG